MQENRAANIEEDQPYIITKGRRRGGPRHIKWGRILAVLLVICAAICVGVVIAAQGGKHIKQKARTFYFVQMGEYLTQNDTTQKVEQLRLSGGAGYVYNDGSYRVMASVYLSESDAATVANRLAAEGQNATVYSLSAPAVKYRAKDDAVFNKTLADCMAYPLNLFRNVYDISLKLDTSEVSESLALLQITALKNESLKKSEALQGRSEPIAKIVLSQYLETAALLEDAVRLDGGTRVGVRIKYALCAMAQTICSKTLEASKC